MTNWLERAKNEIQTPLGKSTANAAVRTLTSVMAVLPSEEFPSNGSNGSTDSLGRQDLESGIKNPFYEEGAAEDLRLPGISPEFAARLSVSALADIAAGDIPLAQVQAFEEAAIAREVGDLREFFEERAGILEHDAGLPRPQAELEAARMTATLARNRGYLWASLRGALAEHPVLLAQVPDTPGPIDALPLGVATLAVLPGRRVVRQGRFIGEHEATA